MKTITSINFANSTTFTTESTTVVPVINIEWPANFEAVKYFKTRYNLLEEGTEIDWTHTVEYLTVVHNEFCVRKFLEALPKSFQDQVRGSATVISVQIFDPTTHALIGTATVV
jgi:hypothetical protein